ncbi:MAG: nucleotidyl transferase AbiEii/AbiGii toxin family protein [Candidatus Falkowbacteria bacterium]
MHKEILTSEQIGLLPLIKKFSGNFGLAGGTAIALHIGHRESIDFDLFSTVGIKAADIRKKIIEKNSLERALVDNKDEYTVIVNKVKFTFLHYPFPIEFKENFAGVIKVVDLAALGAMKAYALGRRSKWKDYVDLYFILKHHYPLKKISREAEKIFGQEFNEKIFRSQLAYFKDMDYSEEIIYKKGCYTSKEKIMKELVKFSVGR